MGGWKGPEGSQSVLQVLQSPHSRRTASVNGGSVDFPDRGNYRRLRAGIDEGADCGLAQVHGARAVMANSCLTPKILSDAVARSRRKCNPALVALGHETVSDGNYRSMPGEGRSSLTLPKIWATSVML